MVFLLYFFSEDERARVQALALIHKISQNATSHFPKKYAKFSKNMKKTLLFLFIFALFSLLFPITQFFVHATHSAEGMSVMNHTLNGASECADTHCAPLQSQEMPTAQKNCIEHCLSAATNASAQIVPSVLVAFFGVIFLAVWHNFQREQKRRKFFSWFDQHFQPLYLFNTVILRN